MIAVDLIEGFKDFHPPPLQLDMHQGQAVDQDSDIIAINAVTFLRDLVGDLKTVFAPFVGVEEVDALLAVIIPAKVI